MGKAEQYPPQISDFPLLMTVLTVFCLHRSSPHMPMDEIRNYLSEIHRVLCESGKVLLSVFFNEDDNEIVRDHINFYISKESFLQALRDTNFEDTFLGITADHHWYILRPVRSRGNDGSI
jgi:hypothetical protein